MHRSIRTETLLPCSLRLLLYGTGVAVVVALLMPSLGAAQSPEAANSGRAPNIVFILIDDLGYMDVGSYNPDTFYETPRLDRLAGEGMRFTDGYTASPVCSPTRYSIVTGRYPTRVRATNWFTGVREGRFRPAPLNNFMPLDEFTLAEALREEGYRTAFVGKWHLGPTEEYWPENRGFEVNIGGHHRGSPPGGFFAPYDNPRLESGPDGEYLPERLVDESLRLLESFREEPFLLYLSFYTVHTPLQAPEELVEKYRARAAALATDEPDFAEEEQVWPVDEPRRVRIRQNHAVYAAMVEAMDQQVGRVLDGLERLGLAENTMVFFFSDNGGLSTSEGHPTSNLPLRAGKGWVYEGGIRVPLIVRWPGVVEPGSVCREPVISNDFYPTILEAAGLPLRPDQHLDGASLVPLLRGEGGLDREVLYWHYPHYSNQGGLPGGAVRMGPYKLVERYEDGRVHLYDLDEDLGEQHDLAESMPERVDAMRERLHAWYEEVDAQFLRPLPDGPEPWQP